jgi:SAM-dependent methyltransferase
MPENAATVPASLLDVLACPTCRSQFHAAADALACEQGHRFPVTAGVARLTGSDENRDINLSFTQQWDQFDYSRDRTWGLAPPERIAHFLKQMDLSQADVAGKLVLDAGCGNGVLSAAVAQLGASVVATDISDSVFAASKRFAATKDLLFVQSDLMSSVFKPESFDLIYSGGVLHHTPNTRTAFYEVVNALRPGGRIFVWLYWTVPGRATAIRSAARRAISPFPLRAKRAVAVLWSAASAVRGRDGLTWRERILTNVDYFTPRYRWDHTPTEVCQWYAERGLVDVKVTDEVRDGFGVVGTAPTRETQSASSPVASSSRTGDLDRI